MPGTRQPTDVVIANGRKHLTQAEIVQRKSQEVSVTAPKEGEGSKIRAPIWLPKSLVGEFNELRADLVNAGIFSRLDRDALGAYLIARRQYVAASRKVQDALDMEDEESSAAWSNLQEKYFKQARACAGDLGLTITSRCRLVIPSPPPSSQPANPVLQLLARKSERVGNG